MVFQADYDGVRAYKTLRKSHSPSDSYLQLRLLNERPKVKHQHKFFNVRSNVKKVHMLKDSQNGVKTY